MPEATTLTRPPQLPSPAKPAHVDVQGIPIFDGGVDDAVGWCFARLRAGEGARIATANLDFLAQAGANPALASDLRGSHLVVPDGMPVVWLARLNGARSARRVAGVDLVTRLCSRPPGMDPRRVAIYGSTDEIAAAAARALADRCGAHVVEIICPPFRQLDATEIGHYQRRLCDAEPDLVLVALGCPRQERLIADWFEHIPSAIWIGVGGSMDFFAGRRKRAPKFLQSLGLEWVVRLVQEPARLGPRYIGRDIPALGRLGFASLLTRLRRRQQSY